MPCFLSEEFMILVKVKKKFIRRKKSQPVGKELFLTKTEYELYKDYVRIIKVSGYACITK